MNERIRELAEQAGLKWKAQPPHYTNTNNPIDFPVSANRDLEKFAELIVRECDRYVAEQYDELEPWMQPGDLLKHFGVEEQATELVELHSCPYAEELYGNYDKMCDCDEERTRQCAMDI